jgi:hypothetical protein
MSDSMNATERAQVMAAWYSKAQMVTGSYDGFYLQYALLGSHRNDTEVPNEILYHLNRNNVFTVCGAKKRRCRFDEHITETEYLTQFPPARKKVRAKKAAATVPAVRGRSDTSQVVDKLTSTLILSDSDFVTKITEVSEAIAAENDNRKPIVYRSQTATAIKASLTQLRDLMVSVTGETNPDLSISANNKIGSDVEHPSSNTSFELKFGSETSVNGGMEAFQLIIPDPAGLKLPTAEQKKAWKKLVVEGKLDEQLTQYQDAMKVMADSIPMGVLPDLAQKILNHYYKGYRSAEEINTLLNASTTARKVVKLVVEPVTLNWSIATLTPLTVENGWSLVSRAMEPKSKRLNLRYEHVDGVKFRVTLNNKNTYRWTDPETGIRYEAPAKNGLGSLSFNGWMTPA